MEFCATGAMLEKFGIGKAKSGFIILVEIEFAEIEIGREEAGIATIAYEFGTEMIEKLV